MYQFKKGDLAWVHDEGGFLDLAHGTLVTVMHTERGYTVVRPVLYCGEYSRTGYFMSDSRQPQLIPIELETEASRGTQTDVPQPQSKLPEPG